MKKIILLSLCVSLSIFGVAQDKFGYIDSSELLELMPEKKTAEEELTKFAKSLEAQLSAMNAEYQASITNYKDNESSYTDLVKQDKIAEITGLEQRIQSFNKNAQIELQKKEQELFEPLLKRAREAIENVAKAGKFTYIFDSSMGGVLYADENENILSLVKKELGI